MKILEEHRVYEKYKENLRKIKGGNTTNKLQIIRWKIDIHIIK
jgi:hypothetical protein